MCMHSQHILELEFRMTCDLHLPKTGPPNPENVPEDGKLKSEMMIKDNRRYYLDLKENTRGRFLRVSSRAAVHLANAQTQLIQCAFAS